jgi:hypothetical protein
VGLALSIERTTRYSEAAPLGLSFIADVERGDAIFDRRRSGRFSEAGEWIEIAVISFTKPAESRDKTDERA